MTSIAADDEVVRESRRILSTHSRSFDWAARFLPPERRDAAAVVYAFCRTVDDVADEAVDAETAGERLTRIEAELVGKKDERPLVQGFRRVCRRRSIDLAYPRELIRGVESDLGPVRIASDRELLRYCYRVAGTVGLMMAPLLGVSDQRALPHAIDLGIAMQLTNICRDVLEDAENGRVYLPRERLDAVGSSQSAILDGRADRDAVASVVGDILELAEPYYESGQRGMRYIPRRSRLAIMVASRVYRAIGLKLRDNGCDALAGRTIVGPLGKLRRVLRATLRFFNPFARSDRGRHEHRLHRPLAGLPGANDDLAELGAA